MGKCYHNIVYFSIKDFVQAQLMKDEIYYKIDYYKPMFFTMDFSFFNV